MLKKFLVVTTAALALAAASSLPASADVCNPGQVPDPNGFGCVDAPVSVPEPSSIWATVAVAGTLVTMKVFGAKKNAKETVVS